MAEEYDKERAAALIRAGRDITAHLKAETELIKRQMEKVLTGGEEVEETDAPKRAKVADHASIGASVGESTPVAKARWRFWR
jgi:hypothetical protein